MEGPAMGDPVMEDPATGMILLEITVPVAAATSLT